MPHHANSGSFKPGHVSWSKGKAMPQQVKETLRQQALQPCRIAVSISNLPKAVAGKQNPNWRGGHHKKCAVCGSLYWVRPYAERVSKYCSRECHQKAVGFRKGQAAWNQLNPNLEPTPTLAYILGVVLGDGSVSVRPPSYSVILCTTTEAFNLAFAQALSAIGLRPRTYRYWSRNAYITRAFSKRLVAWLHTVNISVFLSDRLTKLAFIKGFYESEGGCHNNGHSWQIVISNTDLELLQTARRCLGDLGYSFHFRLAHPVMGRRKALYQLHKATKAEVQRFMVEVNPCIKRGPYAERHLCGAGQRTPPLGLSSGSQAEGDS